ncbi:uncharacterized protein MKZ38_004354 [Zalerion maritima]|uniref:CRAL-TRIO domain-containing protein n=1 Tax=Zalerion maritima TaxID=339359 RepID=A0AAD5RMM5_9PEZI|nr:uncharacterized protein MKZ38_004354 [Zalerion maritima]
MRALPRFGLPTRTLSQRPRGLHTERTFSAVTRATHKNPNWTPSRQYTLKHTHPNLRGGRLNSPSPRYSSASQSHPQGPHQSHEPHHHYLSLAFYFAPLYVTLACIGFVYFESTFHLELLQPEDEEEFSAMEILPGRPGNLTPEQDEKLRQLWAAIFKLCNVASEEELSAAMAEASISSPTTSTGPTPRLTMGAESIDKDGKTKKKRLGLFSRNKGGKDESEKETQIASPTPAALGADGSTSALKTTRRETTPLPPGTDAEDKYGQTKHFLETLEKQSPESIRSTIWGMVKHDHPDALVLRFLRARKWDVDKALVMLISTMNWRHEQMNVDDVIMKEGELFPAELEKAEDTPRQTKTLMRDFLSQIRMGKSFLHGVDRHGRPICVIRVRYHKAGEQCEESLERYTVYLIETARMVLAPPVDTATVVFDMTSFSMANMDYTPVKFMIKCFEANYPESLGAVLVHKAPWVFQGIWKIIRGWLDPVVASKVHFTNSAKDMEEFIAPEHIPKELEGKENWEYKYVEPVPGENDKMKDTATRDKLLQEREAQVTEYEQLTMKWIAKPDDETLRMERAAVAEKLRKGYWELDPFIRARSLYDRVGMLREGGEVVPYPEEGVEKEGEKANGEKKVAADDDVD